MNSSTRSGQRLHRRDGLNRCNMPFLLVATVLILSASAPQQRIEALRQFCASSREGLKPIRPAFRRDSFYSPNPLVPEN